MYWNWANTIDELTVKNDRYLKKTIICWDNNLKRVDGNHNGLCTGNYGKKKNVCRLVPGTGSRYIITTYVDMRYTEYGYIKYECRKKSVCINACVRYNICTLNNIKYYIVTRVRVETPPSPCTFGHCARARARVPSFDFTFYRSRSSSYDVTRSPRHESAQCLLLTCVRQTLL